MRHPFSNSNRSTPMLFSGKNIIVTGATGDLGVAIVQRLISQGANVLAVAGHQSEISRLATFSGPGTLETSVADVFDAEQVLAYATRAFALWGQIDGFVNNAGIQTPVRPIVDFPEEDFDRVMAVNVRGMFLGLKHVLPRMREGGSVVNMSSALGLVGGAGICPYVASKHAIIGLTKTAALEQGARKVRVNACCPGPIAGRMTFKLADEAFAGSNKTFAETVPLGRHGTGRCSGPRLLPVVGRLHVCDRHHTFGRRRLHDRLIAFSGETVDAQFTKKRKYMAQRN